MKTPLAARAAALLIALTAAAAPMAAAAAPAEQNRPQQQQQRDSDRRDNDRSDRNNDDRYGRWDSRWGARPPAPPRSFTRASDWHRHVRACQQRYRSYNPATDRYTVRRGQTALCRL